ncbi:PTS sugar transporter subunit IIC [Lactiplantibacillus garii]|uniref:Permease IIC component n=1 Tax=Lactiplantibacillus garii TaxID=2306423 RepID=A0A3R8LJ38_9LACO|nr:PTS transporter subunit EIIC [Lactiplantibacillus garii]RRK09846.1 PTS sugar transporter subunit IIC [Lactiplantibacillus garii]
MGVSEQRLIQRLVPTLLRLRQTNFYRVIQRTLMLTFPFILIGTFSQIIQLTVLTKSGFFASVFHLAKWVPYYKYLHYPFDNLTNLTLDSVSIVAAYGAAKYAAKLQNRDEQLAGLTGAIALLLMAYQYTNQAQVGVFNALMLGTNGLTGALLVGGVTGLCFKWFGKAGDEPRSPHTAEILSRTFGSLLPMLITLLVALVVSLGLHWVVMATYSEENWTAFQKFATTSHSLWLTFGMAALTLFLEIIGLFGPYQQQLVANAPAMNTNLSYALSHHSAYNVPFPYTANTLYHAFGTFGGTGMLLALVIAIFINSNNHNYHVVARWGLLPALFNSNGPILTGLPVLYNPIYLIPFMVAPLVNMGIAAVAVALKWIPAVVYPVPIGTPGPLIAFIGTNGNLVAFLLGIVCLAVSVVIYLPFLHLAEAIADAAQAELAREGGPRHVEKS